MAAFPEPEAFEKMDLNEHEPIQMNSGATSEQPQSHVTIAADDVAAKSAEIERLKQELVHSRLEMELLQKRSRDMSEDSQIDTVCHINIASRDELEKAELEIKNLRRHLAHSLSKLVIKSSKLEELKEESEKMRIVNETLQSEQNHLTDELVIKSAKIEELKEESAKLRIVNETLQSEQTHLTHELTIKSSKIEELKEESAKMSKKSENDLAEKTIQIQRQTEEIGKLINELDDFKRIINTVEETLKDSNRQMQLSTQRYADEIQTYLNKVQERDTTIKVLDDYSADLEKQLRGIKQQLLSSDNKFADLQLKEECLQREVDDYKSKLDKYMTAVHSQTETITLLQEEYRDQSRSLTRFHEEVKRLNQEREKILKKNDEFQNKLKLKQDELSIEKTKTNKKHPEINILKQEIHANKTTLHNERQKWNAEKSKLEQMCNSAKEETNRITHAFNAVNQECHAVKETLRKTVEERDELTMRLSKLASASLTHNNPNIADLSDPNRPTKLSEAFSELYDNEWTDAFECIKESDERITVSSLLEMLEKAYEFSITLTNQASTNMSGTFTDLSLKYNRGSKDMVTQNSLSRHARIEYTTEQKDMYETSIDDKSKECPNYANNVKSDCDTIGETGISLFLNEETLESNTILMEDSKHHEVTAEQTLPVVKSKTDMTYPTSVCTQDDELHSKDTIQTLPAYVDMAIQVNVDELEAGTCVATVSFDLDKLNPAEKQTITYIRKRILHDLKDQIIPMIANAVSAELNLHACDDSIFTYVKTCASICWEMRIHQPPVCLDFKEVDDETLFNTATYKHYTKAGLRMDYVVWPAMYLYEGGPLLSKGVAQGK